MKWYHYLAAFCAGFFLTNAIPHGVAGIMGETFPSPFADPPGVGHSSALTNVLWSLVNIVIGYILFRVGKVSSQGKMTMFIFFLGAALTASFCGLWFGGTISR